MKSQLKLTIDNSSLYSIGVRDESDYSLELEIQEPLLVVKAPNFSAKGIDFTPNTWNSVNSKDLCISSCIEILPDGIYYVKYSNVPHEKIYVEYHFFRTAYVRSLYDKMLLKMSTEICQYSVTDNPLIKQLIEVDLHIKAAEANVNETCYNANIAIQHYRKAFELINKLLNPYDNVSSCSL